MSPVNEFLASRTHSYDDSENAGRIRSVGVHHRVAQMNDRRVLRRYLALVHHAEDLLDDSLRVPETPPAAEAAAELESLVENVAPAIARMTTTPPEPGDIREQFAGWVH